MFDDLFDSLSDRSRGQRGKSGGLLGKLGQLLEGDFDEDRHQERERRHDGAERDRYAASRRDDREYRRDDDDEDDDREQERRGTRRGFDFDFGD